MAMGIQYLDIQERLEMVVKNEDAQLPFLLPLRRHHQWKKLSLGVITQTSGHAEFSCIAQSVK